MGKQKSPTEDQNKKDFKTLIIKAEKFLKKYSKQSTRLWQNKQKHKQKKEKVKGTLENLKELFAHIKDDNYELTTDDMSKFKTELEELELETKKLNRIGGTFFGNFFPPKKDGDRLFQFFHGTRALASFGTYVDGESGILKKIESLHEDCQKAITLTSIG